ncbi:hypothetical protein [Edaphobacter sp. 12200R-103]|uniref:beta strand repeat-containing protein n=1 Tax=Edaphobacter sp. 12200R-103 TaxID=2703788 RepID=UPI00138B65D9|nr:hypothetical protein [Edaphobacter sp. 12200R-103]QHS53140.1 hypothetical protein GWR55_16475 [Edaphobacter sp. 12200R-103]
MNRLRMLFSFATAIFIALLVVGCSSGTSGGNTPAPPALSVTFTSQPVSTLQVGTATTVSATVSNDATNAGVIWTTTCSSNSCGSFSSSTTNSGSATTYTAPSAVPSGATVIITATSVSDRTTSVSATITITPTPAQPISVVLTTTPPSSLMVGTTASIVALVNNDTANAGVTWNVSCGSSQCGTFSPSQTSSGAATTYTAPTSAPTGSAVTITATSVTDPTKSVTANVTITTPAPSVLADGNYVYNLSGQDNNGNYYVVGAFSVKGGVIIGGEQDFVDPSYAYTTDTVQAAGSSITLTPGSNTQITLATSNSNIGVNGVETFRGTLVSASRVVISEFDSFASATGSIDLQTSTSTLNGGYAFMVNGVDDGTPVGQLVIGGILNFNAGNLVTSGSVFDFNDNGDFGQAQTFASGNVSAPDAFGRITINLAPNSNSQVPGFVLTGYIVGNKIQLLENQNDSLNGVLGGVALAQGANTGKFSQASISNSSYAYGSFGEDANNTNVMIGGAFGFNPDGTLGGRMVFNDLTIHNGNNISGSYTVDPTGRVTLTNVQPSNIVGTFTFQGYLDGNGDALIIGVDDLQATGGIAYVQSANGADFEGNYALSAQGTLNDDGASQWGAVGPVTINSDNIAGFTDYNAQNYPLASNALLNGGENSNDGLLTFTGLNAMSFSSQSSYGYYPIDNNRALAISIGDDQLGLMMLETVSVTK